MKQAILKDIKIIHIPDEIFSNEEENDEAVAVRAVATIYIPSNYFGGDGKERTSYKLQEIETAGLWGCSGDEEYFRSVAEEEIEALKQHLEILNVNMDGGIQLFPTSDNKDTSKSFDEYKNEALSVAAETKYL